METNGLILVSVAVGMGLWYAFKKAYSSSHDELLPPIDYHDMISCIHHVRDSTYLLADTPRTMGNTMGFTAEQGKMFAVMCAEHRHFPLEHVSILESLMTTHESCGIPSLQSVGPRYGFYNQVSDAQNFFIGDCKFTDLICKFNDVFYIPSYIETGCTMVGLSACAFIFLQPSAFLNGMGFGANSFLAKLSWSDYGSIAKATNPLALGGLATTVLTCVTGYGTVSALSQGLVRPLQAVNVFYRGLNVYRYLPGPVTPGTSGVMEGIRELPDPRYICIGENSQRVNLHIGHLQSRSFGTSTALALGGFVSLKCLSNTIN
jgi:hypothetical protein